MIRVNKYIFLFLIFITVGAYATDDISKDFLQKLDKTLSRRDDYVKQKEQEISRYRGFLGMAQNDLLYKTYINLYNEYKSYKYDSAYVYAEKSMQMARSLGKCDYMVESKCAATFCLLSTGLYKEALDVFNSIDITDAGKDYVKMYYKLGGRLYYEMADYSHQNPYSDIYVRRGGLYTDSLLAYLDPNSADMLYAEGMRKMKEHRQDESIATFKLLMERFGGGTDTHTKAIVTSCIGWMYLVKNERDSAKIYLAESAKYDTESATKETTSLCVLASMLYEDGNIEYATRYIKLSLDDANFYGSRLRKIQIGDILPIIEQDRYNIVRNERNAMLAFFVAAVLGVIFLVIGGYIIRKQMKKIQIAKKTIEERNEALNITNDRLSKANSELSIKNNQLCEVNAIKDEYIGKSFYLNSEYINKVEKLYKTIDRKITTRQYDELRSSLKDSKLATERRNMFEGFDETFIKLFPDFVREYNLLFDEKDRRMPDNDRSLTTEMRIYALVRLGISDSERIAKFLNYSVHTINTYKTRIKNKSIVDNNEFDQRIMAI